MPGSTSYDAVAYPGLPFPQTHPDRLAVLATLFGMAPAPPQRCRCLELGCGDGFNLIPMAYTLPDSVFVGIDLSANAVERGRQLARELRLSNLSLEHADVSTWRPDQPFDFIIAHGLFSWVPPPIQESILTLCREWLAPHGVAYISYNALPGGHIRRMLRDMLRFHTRGFADPSERMDQARSLLRLLLAGQTEKNEFTALLRKESERILDRANDAVLYHDDLAETNHFFFVHEFAALASRFGLQFLAEADFFEMQDRIYPPEVAAVLGQLEKDIVLKEQYLDFLKCRRFRQTLLCRDNLNLQRDIPATAITRFRIASPAKPKGAVDLAPRAIVRFEGTRGATMQIDHPLTKAAMLELANRFPESLPFDELAATAARRLQGKVRDPDAESVLAEVLLAAFSAGIIELHLLPPVWSSAVGAKPCVSELVRRQLAAGNSLVTTLRHTTLELLDSADRSLLQLMDGTHELSALADAAARIAASDETLPPAAFVQRTLERAVRSALLIR